MKKEMNGAHVLVVDAEKLIRWSLRERLSKEKLRITEASTGAEAGPAIESNGIDLILLDLKLPDTDGISILKTVQKDHPEIPVIIMTAFSSVDTAIQAMKQGAYDYLTKPFNMDDLVITVHRALETRTLKREMAGMVTAQKRRFGLSTLIGRSPKIQEVFTIVRKIAQSNASTVLLRGESGVGKDVIARAIHYESARATRPFMTITCTALQDTLLESELFGHEQGAFTDAKSQKQGLFELAGGGTIFMDEIGDMSPSLQAKLLRSLEAKTFKRIGGTKDIEVDVRIVAATNRDLERSVKEGSFREDLYYRLNVIPITVPTLRERTEDIPLLAEHFMTHFTREFRKPGRMLSAAAMDKLCHYAWPGNIRELRNAIERALLLGEGASIEPGDLLLGRTTPEQAKSEDLFHLPPEGIVLEDLERDLVRQALDQTRGNQTRAAALLDISRDQIRYRMEKFGMLSPDAGKSASR